MTMFVLPIVCLIDVHSGDCLSNSNVHLSIVKYCLLAQFGVTMNTLFASKLNNAHTCNCRNLFENVSHVYPRTCLIFTIMLTQPKTVLTVISFV